MKQLTEEEQEKAIILLKELTESTRYTIPRSNALNKAYYEAKSFLEKITKKNN